LNYEISLKKLNSRFPAIQNDDIEWEAPSVLLWTYFLISSHYDKLQNSEKAFAYLELAIAHTPTVIDLYLMKAQLYKHSGDPLRASMMLEKARNMDLADRYLNTRSTLFALRADLVEQAESTIALFTKDSDSVANNLFDMQCMWYEIENGDSYYRTGQFGKALKKYTDVEKHFLQFIEDQFDFHTYCIRKMTIRSYIKMLRMEDTIYGHKFYVRSACGAINTYLKLFDQPKKEVVESSDTDTLNLDPAERKKAESKRRKELAKKKQAEQSKIEVTTSGSKKGDKKPSPSVETTSLADTEDPLAEATKFLKNLKIFAPKNLDTHLLAFEVYIRKKKYLLALQAVKKASELNSDHPEVHKLKIRFFSAINNSKDFVHPNIKKVIELEQIKLLDKSNLKDFNDSFLEKYKNSISHRAAAAEIILLYFTEDKQRALQLLTDLNGYTLKDCMRIYNILESVDSIIAANYKTKCYSLFKNSIFFGAKTVKQEAEEKNQSSQPAK